MRTFSEIMGKYRILNGNLWGLKGSTANQQYADNNYNLLFEQLFNQMNILLLSIDLILHNM